jgi:3'-phosphoadenosine 5'-phosphosulfate sulfotransferase (PAPS reductase)/FAD synthetase
MIYVLSISGGKDSAAMWAYMKRLEIGPRRAVACDTGWEADFDDVNWARYLVDLSFAIGEPCRVVQAEIQFAERVLRSGTFPGMLNRRWCTEELKLIPFKEEVDRIRDETGDDVTVVVGIRAEESDARAKMPEREWSDFYDCEMWRPLIDWSLDQVIAEHHAAKIPLNPLYLLGAERVGCWPCVKARKRELRLLGKLDPARVTKVRRLEAATGTTMFCLEAPHRKGQERKLIPTPIDDMIVWANTTHGGKQLAMYHEPTGCARWGICERPVDRDSDED